MQFKINTVIWGKEYVETYLRYSLPSLLSDGNLLDRKVTSQLSLQIMSTAVGFQQMNGNPTYRKIKSLMSLEEVVINEPVMAEQPDTFKYDVVSQMQNSAIKDALNSEIEGILFLYPDFVFSEGFLHKALQTLKKGYDAIFGPVPFISHDQVKRNLFRQHGLEQIVDGIYQIEIPPRILVKLCIDAPHPVNNGFDFHGSEYGEWPGCYYWNIPNEGQLIRSFHVHPFAIRLQKEKNQFAEEFKLSLDDEFVSKNFTPGDNMFFATDSDEFAVCSLRFDADPPHIQHGKRSDLYRTLLWAEEHTTTVMRYFVTQNFYWHYAPITSDTWKTSEKCADDFFEKVNRMLTMTDDYLEFEDVNLSEARKRRLQKGY